jgi:hypothetical protein
LGNFSESKYCICFLKVPVNLNISMFFIDPIVNIFVDPCNPNWIEPEEKEKEIFKDEVSR